MAYVRSKMLLSSQLGRSSARPLPSLSPQSIECTPGTWRELETLRSMNAYLVNEVAALKEREAEVLRLAERDGLTGLFNRRRMLELVDSAIAEAAQTGQCVGLLFIDLNGFKAINDTAGHAAGDTALRDVVSAISERLRPHDLLGRFGGVRSLVH